VDGPSSDSQSAESKSAPEIPAERDLLLQEYLQGLSKKQLVAKFLALAGDLPEVHVRLRDSADPRTKDDKALRKELRREVVRVSRQDAWSDAWSEECHIPDYSGVRRKMSALLEVGQADSLLDEGHEFLQRGIEQVEASNDEGETCAEIADCCPLLVRALRESARTGAEKLCWALEAVLADDYGICEALEQYLREKHPPAVWSEVADKMLAELAKYPVRGKNFTDGYMRGAVSNWIVHALDSAGRPSEALALCEQEAVKNGDYVRLVDRLLADARYDDAEQWIDKGITHTERHAPGIANQLRDKLGEIYTLRQDWPSLILMEVADFVQCPGTSGFDQCRVASEKISAWPDLRQTLLDFLATGRMPWEHPSWPLPGRLPEFTLREKMRFPRADVLTAIAIQEKNAEEALHWFDLHHKNGNRFHTSFYDEAAKTIQAHAPDRAVKIWKGLAEREIARVSPSRYTEAGRYLRKMRTLLHGYGRDTEWQQYIISLRKEHYRKKRFLEVLDGLDEKPLLGK
jgi:uncharacterized Zn finger protein